MTETPEPTAEKPPELPAGPTNPSPPNFAGAILLSSLLVVAWGFNFAAGDSPIVPSWLLYGLMFGILLLLGVDVSKIFRGRGDP